MLGATLFVTINGTIACVGATLHALSAEGPLASVPWPKRGDLLLEGLAESTSPGLMGFAFMTLASLLVAVGRARLDNRAAQHGSVRALDVTPSVKAPAA
jgi:hypothetical protein